MTGFPIAHPPPDSRAKHTRGRAVKFRALAPFAWRACIVGRAAPPPSRRRNARMSGMTLTVCPPTLFDFGNVLASNNMSFNVATRIDASGFESGVLVVRQHTLDVGSVNEVITV